jgi:hypothetical protein
VIVAGIEFVRVAHVRPSYDAFGWLVWGRQVLLHWNLNTDGAPSWKPLSFLFTLPYAAFGQRQLTLWTVTASAAALASGVFAARIAYRLTGLSDEPIQRRWPGVVAGLFAGVAVLGMTGLPHQMLIATSDPMVVTLCLAAIDAHLSGHPRLAFAMIVLASFGRPEAWLFAGLYGVWCWFSVRGTRPFVVVGILLIPAAWFVIPGLTARTWFISGTLALEFHGQIHGNKIAGVMDRFTALYELPMQLAALAAILLGVIRRDRTWLALTAAALLWVGVEIAFAYHGWPASQRYLMEPAAVFIVLAGAAVGRLLDFATHGSAKLLPPALTRAPASTWILRAAALAGVAVLGLALAPLVHRRANLWRAEVRHAERVAVPIDRLYHAVMFAGGPGAIKACGAPVTYVGFQSTLAWDIGLNVGDVGYKPRDEFASGKAIVFFRPVDDGWTIRPVHTPHVALGGCDRLFAAYDAPASVDTWSWLRLPAYQLAVVRLPHALARLRRFDSLRNVFPARRDPRGLDRDTVGTGRVTHRRAAGPRERRVSGGPRRQLRAAGARRSR